MESRRWFHDDITTFRQAFERLVQYRKSKRRADLGGDFLVHSIEDETSEFSNWKCRSNIDENTNPKIRPSTSNSMKYGITLYLSNFPYMSTHGKHPKEINMFFSAKEKNFNLKEKFEGKYQPIIHIPIYEEMHKDPNTGQMATLYFINSSRGSSVAPPTEDSWERLIDLIDYYKIGGNGEDYLQEFFPVSDWKKYSSSKKLPEVKLIYDVYNEHPHELLNYFHPGMYGPQCETILLQKSYKNGAFVLRNSHKNMTSYSLAVKCQQNNNLSEVKHIRIERNPKYMKDKEKNKDARWLMGNKHYASICQIIESGKDDPLRTADGVLVKIDVNQRVKSRGIIHAIDISKEYARRRTPMMIEEDCLLAFWVLESENKFHIK